MRRTRSPSLRSFAAGVAALLLVGSTASASVFPYGTIVFVSNRDYVPDEPGNADVYTMNPDGSVVTQLTDTELPERDPVLSPDGSKVAYEIAGVVYIQDAALDAVPTDVLAGCVPMTSNPCGGAFSPAWSPDGTTIAFAFNENGAWAINTIRLADNDRHWVWYASNTRVADPAWSPDGTKIAFTATTAGQPRIMVKTLGTNMGVGERMLADGKMPAWSPDGYRIAYVDDWWSQSEYGDAADGDDIYVIGACDDCQATPGLPLWQIAGRDWYPSWSSDGTKILFQSESGHTPAVADKDAVFHLWVMDPFPWDDPYPNYYWAPLDLSEFSAFMTWEETGIAYSDSLATWHWPMYDVSGLFSPVQWGFRTLKAGQAVPIKFSLGGDQGLDIFTDGFPRSVTMTDCSVREATGEPVETISAGGSSLTYDAAEDQYIYVWKTDKSWRGCREFQLALKDGTYLTADFLLWR